MIKILSDGVWVDGTPSNGDLVREYSPLGGYTEYTHSGEATKTKYKVSSVALTQDSKTTIGKVHYCKPNIDLSIAASLESVDGSEPLLVDSANGYPEIMSIPLIKIVDNNKLKPIDEFDMYVSFNSGVISATGRFPSVGHWVISMNRVNHALELIGANWRVVMSDMSIKVI